MRSMLTIAALSGVVLSGINLPVYAQQTGPAPVINIIRESIKEGRTAAHERVEADFAATFRKGNHPAHYVALEAMSGASEAWFIEPMANFAANEEFEKASDKEPLKSALAMMDSRDGELRASSRTIWAVYRPDMSYHPERFDPVKTRFVMVGVFRARLGREADFTAGTKTYFGAMEKASIDECNLGYQVVAGAPAGTYLFFTPMLSMKEMDEEPAHMQALQQAMGAENFGQFMKSSGDVIASIEDTLLEVKPGMSYAPQRYIDADPAFWKPKPVARPASAAAPETKPPEKKP